MQAIGDMDLENPELYINRELSLLAFHRRVLDMASDTETPLLERLKFLCISCSNLDEFFEVRVAGLIQQVDFGSQQTGPDKMSPQEQLKRISEEAHAIVEEQYRVLNEELLPALEADGIRFLRRDQWTKKQASWIQKYFDEQVLPIVSPVRLDPAHPFPRVQNKGLHFIVVLDGEDAFGHTGGMAVIQAPRPLPRLIALPSGLSEEGSQCFVFLSSVIHAHMNDLFPGMEVRGGYQFRVTRNSDLFVDPEETEDLLRALQGELPSRRYGEEVRLEVAENCPEDLTAFLLGKFGLEHEALYKVAGPVNLHRLMALPDLVDRPTLKYPAFVPGLPHGVAQGSDILDVIANGDVLLHHPFQSFAPVQDLVRQAAADPNVLAIKQTLYRTGSDSLLVDSLVSAARAGKEVTVVIELRARFDEEANISLAARLQEAGAQVVYGVVGYKTHAKMLLVVRKEGSRLKRYVHLGTGNYHSGTARLYTDYGLLTADPAIGEDVHRMFMQLTSLGSAPGLSRLLQAPFGMHKAMLKYIDGEAAAARAGKPACIIAKMNALTDPRIIRALYQASSDGVEIDLVIRGVCSLRPGMAGVSDNIRVRSVVGRFLEHTRIFYFENGGDPRVLCSSADWMTRNLAQRVELCFPILDEKLRKRVIQDGLKPYLAENKQAWCLQSDGQYRRVDSQQDAPERAHDVLLARLSEQFPVMKGKKGKPKKGDKKRAA